MAIGGPDGSSQRHNRPIDNNFFFFCSLSFSFLAELEGSPAIGVGKHEQEDYNSLSPPGIGKDAEVTDDV